jgi:tRNA modification GTPase
MQGALGGQAEAWRKRIIDAMALVTAAIDFADEGDVPLGLVEQALGEASTLRAEITAALARSRGGERLREGLVVAIAGPPNAGKSTLLNRLARREAAIVSPYAGTTRDVIEVHLDLDGYPLTLLDTAGLRDTDDPVEQEGIRRARRRAEAADLVLWLTDRAEAPPHFSAPVWLIETKSDEGSPSSSPGMTQARFRISALRDQGIEELSAALAGFAERALGSAESTLITRVRHRQLLEGAVEALSAAAGVAGEGEEIIAEELRRAAECLGRLTGRIDVEDILDVIFREFCIGK